MIQYIVAAGLGALIGSAQKGKKKYKKGGSVMKKDPATKREILRESDGIMDDADDLIRIADKKRLDRDDKMGIQTLADEMKFRAGNIYDTAQKKLAKGGKTHKFKAGDMYRSDFDYDGMLEFAEGINSKTPRDVMQKFAESAEDVNYHRLATPVFNYLEVDEDPERLKKNMIFELRRAINRRHQKDGTNKRIDEFKYFKKGGTTHKFKAGDMYREDFDYDGMLKFAESISPKTSRDKMRKFAESAEDVNYHDLATPIHHFLQIEEDPERFKKSMIYQLRNSINDYYAENLVKDDKGKIRRVEILGNLAKGGKTNVLDADEVLQHFVMAMLFAGSDDEGVPLDDNYDFDDVDKSSLMKVRELIEKFLHENAEIIEKHNLSAGEVGHDLWLSPTGSGVGFWDRHNEHPTLTEEEGDALHESSEKIMGTDMYAIAYEGGVEIDGLPFQYAKGGKTQGYNARLDESLAMRRGSKRTKKQGYKSRRHESEGMERSMGRRKYASVGTMDKGRRRMAKGGVTDLATETLKKWNEVHSEKQFNRKVEKNQAFNAFKKANNVDVKADQVVAKVFVDGEQVGFAFLISNTTGKPLKRLKFIPSMEKGGCTSCGKRGRKMADGGRVGDKDFVLDYYHVYVDKDDYEEGVTDAVASWDSSDYGESNKSFSSKSALMDFIKEVIDRDTSEDDTKESNFDIESDEDGTTINYGVLCKYNDLDRGYDHYEKATREEIEQWKKGGLELFYVGFTFKVKVFEPRKRAEFARGGKTQGYNSRLDESLSMRHGAGRKKEQGRKDRRDESEAMERSMRRRKYASVDTMDMGNRMMAHGGKTHRQGYDDKLDESLAMRRGAGRTKEQGRKDRRDESAGMERSMGRRKYASVGTMDKGRRKMEDGGMVEYLLYGVAQGKPDYMEEILFVDDKPIRITEKLRDMASAKGFDRLRTSMVDLKIAPDFTKALNFKKGGKTKGRKKVSDFDKLAMKVAARYRAQGMSNEKAMEIGRGTAGKVARQQQAKKRKK